MHNFVTFCHRLQFPSNKNSSCTEYHHHIALFPYPKLIEVARESAMLETISSSDERRLPSVLSCSPSSKRSHRMVWQVPTVRPYLGLSDAWMLVASTKTSRLKNFIPRRPRYLLHVDRFAERLGDGVGEGVAVEKEKWQNDFMKPPAFVFI